MKIGVEKIWLRRAEGKPSECVSLTVTSFEAADAVLAKWSVTAPEFGGYDKCDFKVTYEDGHEYEGRFDLVRRGNPTLARHMRDYVEFGTGEHCPKHMTEERYANYIAFAFKGKTSRVS